MAEGAVYLIECAVCADGSSPAAEFFDALGEGMWTEDPDAEEFPDDAQLRDHDIFLEFCQQLAENGLPPRRTAVNELNHGIWELKRGAKRLSFYDTPGNGTFTPKYKILDFKYSNYPTDDMWWFPDFDAILRLGHAFPKLGEKTRELDIKETLRVRKEDLHHDE